MKATAGEVMQLPPDDEIVMVAGVPPVRAKKARYYEDARFKERLLPVPKDPKVGLEPKPDDRSVLKPVAVPAGNSVVASKAAAVINGAAKPDDDAANGGLRREPGLERHKDIAPKPVKAPANEFDPDAEEPEREVVANRALARDIAIDGAADRTGPRRRHGAVRHVTAFQHSRAVREEKATLDLS